MLGFLGLSEIVLIGATVLGLVLGPKKLPELARSIGRWKKGYKRSMKEADEAVEEMKPDVEAEIEDFKGSVEQ